MKRIKAACVEQTVHFELKEDLEHVEAVKMVRAEVESYKTQLRRRRTKYKIIEESVHPDDSVVIKIKKQYNYYDCGDYLD